MKGMSRLWAAVLAVLLLLQCACASPAPPVSAPVSSAGVSSREESSSAAESSSQAASSAVSSAASSDVSSEVSSDVSSETSSEVSSEESSSETPWVEPDPTPTPAPTPTPSSSETPSETSSAASSDVPPVSSQVSSAVSSEASSEVSSESSSAASSEASSSEPSSQVSSETSVPVSSELSSAPSSSSEGSSSASSAESTGSSSEDTSRGEELSPIEQVVAGAENKSALRLSETPLTSEEEANRYFYDMVAANYIDFGVFVTKPVFAHTAEEYAEMFPGLDSIEMTGAAMYKNGYYFRFRLSRNINFALKTAVLSANTAYLTEKERQAYDALWTVLATYTATGADAANVMAIHDYIVGTTVYSSGSANAYDATGVLVDHTAVRDGYSKAFQLFMDALGIPCVRLTGSASGVSHAWNAVLLNGCWYHVDTTWDDPVPDTGGVSYEYFLVTDSILQQTHSWSASIACTDESMLLLPYSGCVGETLEALTARYTEQVNRGYSAATLVYPTGLATDEEIVLAMGANSYYPSFTRGPWSVLVIPCA